MAVNLESVSFRIGKETYKALSMGGERVISKFMDRRINDVIAGRMLLTDDDFGRNTTAATLSLDHATAQALKAKAAELKIPVSKLVRVIAEKAIAAEKSEKSSNS